MSPSLSVVADNDLAARVETVGERVRRLQAEARQLAKDHVRSLSAAILGAEALAADIAGGGEAYPPGIRDLARRFAEDVRARVQTLDAINARQ
ncbi:hypothetical protein [Phenylobacterium sp.]|uniref:hypothetical protein n=1 Tax=Phenylobacterium sp. TaxID=1871053 RepID=UPI00286A53B7|nr:hypothetical protein [Phenylobacterium sp.]